MTTQSLGDCEDSMRLLMQTVVRQFQKDRRSLGIEPRSSGKDPCNSNGFPQAA